MILSKYGFGEKRQNLINIVYTSARSTIFTNGFFNETINIERGVRQGSPLGPYLSKIALFADDTQCYISDLKSIEIWLHLHTYEHASGAVGNFNKSYGLSVDILNGHEHLCDKIKWTGGKIAALGVNQ